MEAEMSEITGQPLDDVVPVVPSKKTKITMKLKPIISMRRTRSSSVDGDVEEGHHEKETGEGGAGETETFAFVLQDNGEIVKVPIDKISGDGSDAPEGIFCVNLPKDKVKDRNNPLPGANSLHFGSNKRKSKQTPLNYGENDYPQFLVSSSDSSGCSSTNDELSQNEHEHDDHDQMDDVVLDNLDANDLKTLESVLLEKIAEEGNHTLDEESFNMPSIPIQNSPSSSVNVSSTPVVAKTLPVTPISQSTAPRSPSSNSSRKVSECDSLNIRRSQRQQERIDKQEADRIREENQQMLQREKEMMKEGKSPMPVVPSPNIVPGSPVPTLITPNITPVVTTSSTKANVKSSTTTPVIEQQPKSGRESVPTPTSANTNTKSNKRERKIPAIYSDPNFILDDDAKIVLEVADPSKSRPTVAVVAVEKDTKVSEDIQPESEAGETEPEEGIDDPNRLWCICRQPHNNRFMICCDRCEDWFHGKCVGVTKAQGKTIEVEKQVWHCPPCKKILRQEKLLQQQKQRGSLSLSKNRKSVEATTTEKTESKDKSRKSSTSAAQQQQQQQNVPKSPTSKAKPELTPRKQKLTGQQLQQKLAETKRLLSKRMSTSETSTEKAKVENSESCMVCTKAARPDSVYCSDECINIYSESTRSKSSALLDQSSTKNNKVLKRTNSKGELVKSDSNKGNNNFLTFHVLSSGKSTEVVPQKVKEVKKQLGSPTITTPTSKQTSPPSTSSTSTLNKSSTTPGEIKKKLSTSTSDDKSSSSSRRSKEELSNSKQKDKDPSTSSNRKRNSSADHHDKKEKDSKKRERTRKDSESSKKEPIKTESGRGVDNESLLKENIRKTLTVILKERSSKTLTDSEIRRLDTSPESLSKKIEEELTKYFGSASNVKCKAKYRSIYFNLKDENNSLWREIVEGKIKPRTLVRMEPHEMASAELVQWRQSQNQKEMDMIKKSEIDKLAEAKKQALIDSGAEIDKVIVAETETRAMDIADVIKGHDEKSSSKSSADKDKKSDSKKSSSDKKSSSRDRDRKDKHSSSSSSSRRDSSSRRSERHSSRHDKKDDKSVSSHSHSGKDKDESKKSRHDRDKKISFEKDDKDLKRQNSDESTHTNSASASDESISQDSQDFNLKSSSAGAGEIPSSSLSLLSSSKIVERHSTIDSEQEQPSSTIKTPDYADDPLKREGALQPRFKTKIVMHDVGTFNACVFDCSHNASELEQPLFPDSPVPVVGRINPDIVWDYIDKMKKSKEVIVFRLEPASIADKEGYMTFFTYLSSRGRLGVLGCVVSPIKDVYLLPLGEHTPVNRALLPFHGPGLPPVRTHCLLAIVTRHANELLSIPPSILVGSVSSKRKSTSGSSPIDVIKKKARFDIKPGAIAALSNERRRSSSTKTGDDDDDDTPYTPWEEEDDKDDGYEVVSIDDDKIATPEQTLQLSLSELEAKIQREKLEIASMACAIPPAASSTSQIPGLDGIFSGVGGSSSKKEEQIPFFLRMPPPVTTPTKETTPTNSTTTSSKKESSISPSILKTPDKFLNSSSDSESNKEKDKDALPTTTTTSTTTTNDEDVDLDEAYSPGDLPDDDIEEIEISGDEKPSSESAERIEKEKNVQEVEDMEVDDEPLPPGEEKSTVDVLAKPKYQPIPPLIPFSGSSSGAIIDIDLTDDTEEPTQVIPPPYLQRPPQKSLNVQPPPPQEQENNLLDAFPDKIKAPSKMKININLNMGSSTGAGSGSKGSGPSNSSSTS